MNMLNDILTAAVLVTVTVAVHAAGFSLLLSSLMKSRVALATRIYQARLQAKPN